LIIEKTGIEFLRMVKKLLIVAMGFSISAVVLGATADEKSLLQDGFILMSIDGEVNGPDSGDKWFFKFNIDVNDEGKGVIKAGAILELLPSVTLEKIIADVNQRPVRDYRLWGRATKYKGKNFIFPTYFLPLSKVEKLQPSKETKQLQKQESQPDVNIPLKKGEPEQISGPNDILEIPQEVIEKLKTRRIAQPERRPGALQEVKISPQDSNAVESPQEQAQPAKRPEFKPDSTLADRTALLAQQDGGGLVFILDALGRNAPQASLQLLPCEALEMTERGQSALAEAVPFKIAGIMTKYKGKHYLLLQKATRIYNHGNFGG
jgi:hypothetical protein